MVQAKNVYLTHLFEHKTIKSWKNREPVSPSLLYVERVFSRLNPEVICKYFTLEFRYTANSEISSLIIHFNYSHTLIVVFFF